MMNYTAHTCLILGDVVIWCSTLAIGEWFHQRRLSTPVPLKKSNEIVISMNLKEFYSEIESG